MIVMIIRPIMEVSAKPGEITTENPSAEVGKEGESLSDGIDGSALYPLEENGQNGQMSENDAVRQNGQTSDETDAKNSPNASDRTVSEGSSEEENMTSAQQESLCNDEYCSHIYYDLDGRQHALCALGERMQRRMFTEQRKTARYMKQCILQVSRTCMRQVRSAERQRLRNCM